MGETSTRWAVTKRHVELVRSAAAATGVSIEPGWPGDQYIKPQMLWVDEIDDGEAEIPVISGSRMHRDDYFTIRYLSRVAGMADLDATMTRLDELGALLENPSADSPTLLDMPTVLSADFTTNRLTCARTPDGCIGYGLHTVRVHTRLT